MTISPDFIDELRRRFSGDIRLDPATRILYSTDASIYQIEPLGVVLPRTQDDLQAAVEVAVKHNVPILPRGSGSSLAGQAIGEALIIDCSRWLDKIINIDPESHTAIVEPGVILHALNKAAAGYGLQFGPDPASAERATMGGVIGNNATGAHSILYGMTADHLLAAEVILSDGSLATWKSIRPSADLFRRKNNGRQDEILRAALEIRGKYAEAIRIHYPSSWRNSAGYRLNYLIPWSPSAPAQWIGDAYPPFSPDKLNLAPLLAGSEGTLAVIRRATVGLVPKPGFSVLGILAYGSIVAACDDVPAMLSKNPSAVELIPQMLIRLARSIPAFASQIDWVQGDPEALLVIEFAGDDRNALRERALALRPDVLVAESPEDQAKVWNVRKVGLGIFDSHPSSTRPVAFIEDCAIPVDRLGEFVRSVQQILMDHGTTAAFYAHASAGCLHIRPLMDLMSGEGVRALRSIAEQTLALTLGLGGAMASEHGDGIVRGEWLSRTYGQDVFEAFRILKRAADPKGLLNPKKKINAPPMDTHLRYGEGYQSSTWLASLDFSRNNGLAGAIEQCNGQGVCRKHDGVMCPSYMATRDEKHSTRGRANLLRAMISRKSEIGRRRIEPDVRDALDLCLACKGCKAECPSGVDMAKIKYEFQAHYYKGHLRPLRDYLFAYINQLAVLASLFGNLINWMGEQRLFRLLGERLGVSAARRLPKFHCRQTRPITRRFVESVILLPDTFTRFFEPEIETAAMDVLAACEVDVIILPVLGAGRTLISKGFIESGRRQAERLLNTIQRLDPGGQVPVIGLEPSELYTLRDELVDLLPHRAKEVELLAARTWLIDEYLIRPGKEVEKRIFRVARITQLKNRKIRPRIALHGHCYQKAQPPSSDGYATGVEASAELLSDVGYDVEIIPSGCCGMAGAFGYESEHYEVSMNVGELVLLPAVRKYNDKGVKIAAMGTSCRSQIFDGTGVSAHHTINFVADAVKKHEL
jgi:FAD/FMN-containing dehydrogenase/Fe-S oxidoreductase